MTPEKLAAHLRLEPNRMLGEYSLFVIDEAHMVGDAERGWVLESALGFLHGAARTSGACVMHQLPYVAAGVCAGTRRAKLLSVMNDLYHPPSSRPARPATAAAWWQR